MCADVRVGSKCEELALSICCPLITPIATTERTSRIGRFVPEPEVLAFLVCPDPGGLDDGPPFLDFGLLKCGKRLGCLAVLRGNLLRKIDQPLTH